MGEAGEYDEQLPQTYVCYTKEEAAIWAKN